MLASVSVANFRCIHFAELELNERATGIVGANAAGKTSLLEAIFFIAHSRSFRTANRAELIEQGASQLRVITSVMNGADSLVSLGIEFDGSNSRMKMGGKPTTPSQVATFVPVQVIDPSVHKLLEEGSLRRRRLMDWGVFHVEPRFLAAWRKYQRALVHRNKLLQSTASVSLLEPWTEIMSGCSTVIDIARREYSSNLALTFEPLATDLLELPVKLRYSRGWAAEHDFRAAVAASRGREVSQHTTVVGPHRADLEIRIDGALARKRVSRGQQKLLASILVLSQIAVRARTESLPACLLLDDPAAELDVDNLGKLLKIVSRVPAQLIVSSLEESRLQDLEIGRMFHVERGRFRQVL
jgi:DNA replication and repair protein RecF